MKVTNSYIPYNDQKIKIYKVKNKFKFGILHYAKIKDNQRLKYTVYSKLYSTKEKAIKLAKDLIDDNLISGKWTTKLRT